MVANLISLFVVCVSKLDLLKGSSICMSLIMHQYCNMLPDRKMDQHGSHRIKIAYQQYQSVQNVKSHTKTIPHFLFCFLYRVHFVDHCSPLIIALKCVVVFNKNWQST